MTNQELPPLPHSRTPRKAKALGRQMLGPLLSDPELEIHTHSLGAEPLGTDPETWRPTIRVRPEDIAQVGEGILALGYKAGEFSLKPTHKVESQ